MYDVTDLLRLIKKISLDAVKASYPTEVLFGNVISVSPLKIALEQKLILTKAQLVMTKNVTDHDMLISINNEKRTYTIHTGLSIGDKVVLLQMQGGQKFVVLDKVVDQ